MRVYDVLGGGYFCALVVPPLPTDIAVKYSYNKDFASRRSPPHLVPLPELLRKNLCFSFFVLAACYITLYL